MACIVELESLAATCGKNNVGGISRIYLSNRSAWKYQRLTAPSDYRKNVVVELITQESKKTMDVLGFKRYDLVPEVSNYTVTLNKSIENNTKFFTTELNLVFNTLDLTQYVNLTNMIDGEFVVVMVNNDGTPLFVGNDQPVRVTGGTIASGTALEDGAQITLQLKCDSKENPRILSNKGIEGEI